MFDLIHLPYDVLLRILRFLGVLDLANASQICRVAYAEWRDLPLDRFSLNHGQTVYFWPREAIKRLFRPTALQIIVMRGFKIVDASTILWISSCRNLKVLDLWKSTYRGLYRLSSLNRLESFEYGRGSKISKKDSQMFKGMTSLKQLWLFDQVATDASLVHLTALTRLNNLKLDYNSNLVDKGYACIRAFQTLVRLSLCESGLNDDGATHLIQLTNLTWLDVMYVESLTTRGTRCLLSLPALHTLIYEQMEIETGNSQWNDDLATMAANHPKLADLSISDITCLSERVRTSFFSMKRVNVIQFDD
eukprot:TRINITY_DN670_c0_g1_i1.p1 TRINITY_DN670_c0_g1~~TRINITY_DN670_c0_g1_i1.p1  ORF type:complete len:305 (+),score=-13.12 TRINITY_DN670_c0_g1_i1:78-992(+)